MIVNDTYGMEFDSVMHVGVDAVKSMRLRAEHRFNPERVDLGHRHGHKTFQLVRVNIEGGSAVQAEADVKELGTIAEGTYVSIMVRNIGRSPARARPMLIGTLA